MENDIVEYLKDVGYTGTLLNADMLVQAVDGGVNSKEARDLTIWLCSQLTSLLHLDSTVANIDSDDDLASFIMEIGSLLKEIGCPYLDLIEGPLTERLATKDQCLRLLLFLVSEVMAGKICRINEIESRPTLRINESSTAKDLKSILLGLKFSKPPDNICAKDLFTKIEEKLRETVAKAPEGLWRKSLLTGRLSSDQWAILKQIQFELSGEYRLRREMLLKRLDVTIQSFEWAEQAKGKEDAIAKAFVERRRAINIEPGVSLSDVIAARQDAAIIEKTSSVSARKNTTSAVHKIIIGRVPDRGGRPSEQDAPPPEMPSWQKDRAQGGGGGGGGFVRGGGGGFGRGGGGGRVQGGWNPGTQDRDGGDQREQRGGYNQRSDRRDGGDQREQRGVYNQRSDRRDGGDQREQRGGYNQRSDRRDGGDQREQRGGYNQRGNRRDDGGGRDNRDQRGGYDRRDDRGYDRRDSHEDKGGQGGYSGRDEYKDQRGYRGDGGRGGKGGQYR